MKIRAIEKFYTWAPLNIWGWRLQGWLNPHLCGQHSCGRRERWRWLRRWCTSASASGAQPSATGVTVKYPKPNQTRPDRRSLPFYPVKTYCNRIKCAHRSWTQHIRYKTLSQLNLHKTFMILGSTFSASISVSPFLSKRKELRLHFWDLVRLTP